MINFLHHRHKIWRYGARRAIFWRWHDLQDQGKSVQSVYIASWNPF